MKKVIILFLVLNLSACTINTGISKDDTSRARLTEEETQTKSKSGSFKSRHGLTGMTRSRLQQDLSDK